MDSGNTTVFERTSVVIWWPEVCGNSSPDDAFWNDAISIDTPVPDLTQCFQKTVLSWIPWAYMVIASCFYIPLLVRTRTVNRWRYTSNFNIAKMLMCVLLVCLSLVNLIDCLVDQNSGVERPLADLIECIAYVMIYILAAFVTHYEFRKGIHSGGVLFVLWTTLIVLLIIPFRSLILHVSYDLNNVAHPEDLLTFVTFYMIYTLILIQFVCSWFSDLKALVWLRKKEDKIPLIIEPDTEEEPVYSNRCPELTAPFWSKMLFVWLSGMIVKGYKKTLEFGDLWQLMPDDRSSTIVPRVVSYWAQEVSKHKFEMVNRRSDESKIIRFRDISSSGKTKISHVTDNVFKNALNPPRAVDPAFDDIRKGERENQKLPSILTVLAKSFGWLYLIGGLHNLIYTLLIFLSPILLNALITFVAVPNAYEWQGYLFVLGLFLSNCLKTVFNQWYWHCCYKVGLRVRTAVIAIIYRKALKLNNSAKKSSTMGEIVNLMSVDAQKLQEAQAYLHLLWASPLTVGLALYFLWQELGPSVLAGFALMLLLVPLNAFVAQKTRTLQIMQMRWKDQRIKLMNEILNGIKVLKLYAWESSFQARVNVIREKEVRVLRTSQFLSAVSAISWFMAPYFVAIGSFSVYVLSDPSHVLDANKAFVSLSLFNIMNFPLSMLPGCIAYGVQAAVSIARINRFLRNEELNPENVKRGGFGSKHAVRIEDADFSWIADEEPALQNISLNVEEGKLVAIVGQVGAGKSSLLSGTLGEMEVMKGKVSVKGQVAYVSQQAWIQNTTLRKNILFGKDYHDFKYNKVIDACALGPDLDILPGGDQIEIGEKGINLSGGQKQRVSLARSVYQNADVYLLDDPLSAVDAHVGKHIFENVIGPNGMLKHRTRLFVTNAVTYLPSCDVIVVLKNGRVAEMGAYSELIARKGDFAEYIATYLRDHDQDSDSDDSQETLVKEEMLRQISGLSDQEFLSIHETDTIDDGSVFSGALSRKSTKSRQKRKRHMSRRTMSVMSDKEVIQLEEKKLHDQKLTEEEMANQGSISYAVFKSWLASCGAVPVTLCLTFYALYIASQITTNIWLSAWSSDVPYPNGTQDLDQRNLRLGVYGGLGGVQGEAVTAVGIWKLTCMFIHTLCAVFSAGEAVTAVGIWKLFGSQAENWYLGLFPLTAFAIGTLGQAISLAIGCVGASRVLHHQLLNNILKAPMAFFDTTPMGRIVNRFSKDVDTVDVNIPLTLRIWMGTFAACASTIFVIVYSTPIFLVVLVPLSVIYYFIQRFYIATSRQLKRIESVRRSPIYAHFSETLSGTSSIRAYKQQNRFIQKADRIMDENQMAYYPNIVSMRWLGMALDAIGNLIVLFSGLFAVLQKDSINASLAGLSVTYALQITGTLNICVRMTSDLETFIVSVERIKEYMDCPKEAPAIVEGNRPGWAWPDEGRVELQGYSTRYRPGLDLVLKGVTCSINPGEKIGVVGRTGAGKSSLTLALFRIIEAASGRILIDGTTISHMGLFDLRSRVTIIPQDPVLFSGTLRMNLDPFEHYADSEVWAALEHAHLTDFVCSLPETLEHMCTEGGENLSVGQRQLVCLARALLRKTKILVLDEATAAVDLETDDLIQETIRSEFEHATVITIAHRLNTIMDYDRILVMDAGRLTEFAPPGQLLENKNSLFYKMASDAGLTGTSHS